MSLINWNPNYSVGIDEMDTQHQKLLEIMNNLYDAILASKGKTVLEEVFNDLADYVKTHFSAEENLMQKYNYPDYETHIKVHRDLENQVLEYQRKFQNGEAVVGAEIMTFLKEWLINHILRMDKKYGNFIKEGK